MSDIFMAHAVEFPYKPSDFMNLGYLGQPNIKYAFQLDLGGYYYVYFVNET